jgi:hypothetical protein
MTGRVDITTKMVWTDDDGKRSITVSVHPVNDMDVLYKCSGTEDQLLEMDETAWHALYGMMGEVKP